LRVVCGSWLTALRTVDRHLNDSNFAGYLLKYPALLAKRLIPAHTAKGVGAGLSNLRRHSALG
jgi:hypothetical protein